MRIIYSALKRRLGGGGGGEGGGGRRGGGKEGGGGGGLNSKKRRRKRGKEEKKDWGAAICLSVYTRTKRIRCARGGGGRDVWGDKPRGSEDASVEGCIYLEKAKRKRGKNKK